MATVEDGQDGRKATNPRALVVVIAEPSSVLAAAAKYGRNSIGHDSTSGSHGLKLMAWRAFAPAGQQTSSYNNTGRHRSCLYSARCCRRPAYERDLCQGFQLRLTAHSGDKCTLDEWEYVLYSMYCMYILYMTFM